MEWCWRHIFCFWHSYRFLWSRKPVDPGQEVIPRSSSLSDFAGSPIFAWLLCWPGCHIFVLTGFMGKEQMTLQHPLTCMQLPRSADTLRPEGSQASLMKKIADGLTHSNAFWLLLVPFCCWRLQHLCRSAFRPCMPHAGQQLFERWIGSWEHRTLRSDLKLQAPKYKTPLTCAYLGRSAHQRLEISSVACMLYPCVWLLCHYPCCRRECYCAYSALTNVVTPARAWKELILWWVS